MTVTNQNRIKTYVILHGALEVAVETGVLAKNPLPSRETCGIDKDVRESEMRYLTATQARGLVASIDGEEQLLTDFMISTGARVSEAIEIRVGDLDLARGVVLISRSATESHGHIEVKGTKNGKGRVVPLPAGLRDRLREHLNEAGRRFESDALVFQTSGGHQVRPSNFRHRTLTRASERAGLERVRPHDLRSTFASLCAHAGVDIYRVSRWLGHGSIAVTEKRYLGLFQQGSEDASAIDAVMSEVAR